MEDQEAKREAKRARLERLRDENVARYGVGSPEHMAPIFELIGMDMEDDDLRRDFRMFIALTEEK